MHCIIGLDNPAILLISYFSMVRYEHYMQALTETAD